ncbi:hypothetical protein BC826DRAFT_384879 [Russula brevipes]|nr:hypothetical protein BC826DRAFT_384879 [Russula brevipes]
MTVHSYVPSCSASCSACLSALLPQQKRLSAPALAVGDGAREPPPSFTPPQSTSPSSPAQMQALSAFLLVPRPTQSAYIPTSDVDGGVQDEWVALTRNLTLVSARAATEQGIVLGDNREEVMMVRILNMTPLSLGVHGIKADDIALHLRVMQNLDEPPQPSTLLYSYAQHFHHGVQASPEVHIDNTTLRLLNPHTNEPGLLSSRVTPPAAVAFLRAPSPPAMPTPPLNIAPLPSRSPSNAPHIATPPLIRQELQQPQQSLGSTRRSRFTMGPRPDCDKCRLGVPGHYAHFD